MGNLKALEFVSLVSFTVIMTVNGQINTPCSSSIITSFTPCFNFITRSTGNGTTPTRDCCDSLRSFVSRNTDCACLIITGNVPISMPFINQSLAISLPQLCNGAVPLQCKASGVPLPPPGPALFAPPPPPPPQRQSPAPDASAPAPAPAFGRQPRVQKASTLAPDGTKSGLRTAAASPSNHSGIRPVVNAKSASNHSYTLSPPLLITLAIMLIFINCF